jgi:hypothetical protein
MAAWPFLIARGRQRGYSVLLAPHFLLAEGDYGFLEEATGPVPGSQPVRVGVATSNHGRRFGLTWSEHRITAADVGGTADPRDEHSRPLLLLYGFLSADTAIDTPAGADLDRARRVALDTYRRFLTDEHGFTTEPSAPLDTHAAEPPVSSGVRAVLAPAPPPARRRVRGLVISAAVVAGAAAAVVVVAIAAGSGSGDPPPSCPDDTTAAGPTRTTSSCGSPTPTTTPDRP